MIHPKWPESRQRQFRACVSPSNNQGGEQRVTTRWFYRVEQNDGVICEGSLALVVNSQ